MTATLSPSGDTTGATDKTNLQNAMNAGGIVTLSPGTYYFNGGVTATDITGLVIQGQGSPSDTVLTWLGGASNFMTFQGCQESGIENVLITASASSPPTGGFAVVFTGNCFHCFARHVNVEYMYNGIEINGATETRINSVMMRPLAGTVGVWFTGTSAVQSYRAIIEDFTGDCPYAGANPTSASERAWAPNTSFSVGQVIFNNGNVYQCVTAGVSAASGSGPSGFPGGFTGTISDGGAAWQFICGDLSWILQDSYGNSLVIDKADCLHGIYGFLMQDSAGLGYGSSAPQWVEIFDLECDHNYSSGIELNAGSGFYASEVWAGSALTNCGLVVYTSFSGEFEVSNSRFYGNCQSGVLVSCPSLHGGFVNCEANNNNQSGSSSGHGFLVASGTSYFHINNCHAGQIHGGSALQLWGILVESGASNHYVVCQNVVSGNATGGVSDGGSGSQKAVSLNVT